MGQITTPWSKPVALPQVGMAVGRVTVPEGTNNAIDWIPQDKQELSGLFEFVWIVDMHMEIIVYLSRKGRIGGDLLVDTRLPILSSKSVPTEAMVRLAS